MSCCADISTVYLHDAGQHRHYSSQVKEVG